MFGFIKKNFFTLCVVIILLFSAFLRFYNYPERFGLAYDQAHDALVVRYALENMKLPLLGPFSSAGPFQTGGEWYWFIMIGSALYIPSVITPWVFLTSLYVLFVLGIILVAKELVNKKFALVVGLLTAISTAQIAQGVNLTNQSPQAIFSLLAIWFSIKFIRTKKIKYIFLLSLSVGTAASIHLQGAALIFLLFFTLIFSGIPRLSTLLLAAFGLFIPWIPVFIADSQNNFSNTRNMLYYYMHDQYRISLDVLGRRWLTFAGVLFPKFLSHVIGGNVVFGYVLPILIIITFIFSILRKKLSKEWLVLLSSFLGSVVILRYTRTPIFDSYIVFLHPFILLLSAWAIYFFMSKYKYVGIIILILVFSFSLKKSIVEINYKGNKLVQNLINIRGELVKKYPPGTKFIVYDPRDKNMASTYSFALFLYEKDLISKNGTKITLVLNKDNSGYEAININKKFNKKNWYPITPEQVYLSTEEWYKIK